MWIAQSFTPWLGAFGLLLNLFGTVMVACSFGKNLGEAHQQDDRGRKIYLASFLHPSWFWFGLGLLAAGFLCQLVVEVQRVLAAS